MPTVQVSFFDRPYDEHSNADFSVGTDGSLHVKGDGYKAVYPSGLWIAAKAHEAAEVMEEAAPEPLKAGDLIKTKSGKGRTGQIIHIDGGSAWICYPDSMINHAHGISRVESLTRA